MSPVGLDRIDQWPLVRPRLVADDARFQLSADRALVDTGVIGIFRMKRARAGVAGFGVVLCPMLNTTDFSLEWTTTKSERPDAVRAAVTGTRAVHLSYGITTKIGRATAAVGCTAD